MKRIAGWLDGRASRTPEWAFSALSEYLAHESGAPPRKWNSSSAAVFVTDRHTGSALVRCDGHTVAIAGRARWEDGSVVEDDIEAVCRLLVERYRLRGALALEGLKGEFAVALIDDEAREAMLAIDRFGIGNLVYQADDRALLFGSTCDLLLRHPFAATDIDAQSLYDYAYFHAVPGPRTIYRGQKRLLPGQFLQWSAKRCAVGTYWQMTFPEESGSVADFKGPFRQALSAAVEHAADGENCGAFLSGGTDSSTVAGLLGAVSTARAKTYSIGFAEAAYDEMEYARIASQHFRTDHHEYYVTADDVVKALPSIVAAYDQPFGNASAVAAYYCAAVAKADGVTRMLAGDGGDELFGGNMRYAKQYQLSLYWKLPAVLRNRLLEPLLLNGRSYIGFLPLRKLRSYVSQAALPMPMRYEAYNLIDRLGKDNVFTPAFIANVDAGVPSQLLRETHRNFDQASLINQMLGIDLKFTLADSDLPKVTRMCELAGVDVAFPLLDERVVELSGRLPARLKLRGTTLRYFFKEALSDFLPGQILRKQKHGFGLPVGPWITTHHRLSELVRDSLSSLKRREIIAPVFIDRLLDEHLKVHSSYFGTMAWVLMMLELWFQRRAATPPTHQ